MTATPIGGVAVINTMADHTDTDTSSRLTVDEAGFLSGTRVMSNAIKGVYGSELYAVAFTGMGAAMLIVNDPTGTSTTHVIGLDALVQLHDQIGEVLVLTAALKGEEA